MVQGPAKEVQEAAQVGVRETAKLVAEWFKRQPEDAQGSPFPLVALIFFFCE
jgi:hypothetical protein